MKKFFLILFTGLILSPVFSQQEVPETEIGIDEHLDSIMPKVYVVNEDGKKVLLNSLITKPTVLNLVYFRCPGICSPLMDGVADLISKSDLQIGKDYQVFTVSFDPSEGTDLAKNKKKNYLKLVKKDNVANGWKFFTGDSANIANITRFFGFKYKKTGNDFLHAAAIAMISPSGKLTRYHYGIQFQPFEFRMSVIEANKGQSQPTINKILQYCFKYDAEGKKYVLNVTRVSATIIFTLALSMFLYLVLRPVLSKRKEKV
ncbi:MAG TPA: SCO family protein [Bacteroidales bacterium]|nr:SCO family protein [Bacteroidales bacterium]